MIKKRFGDTRGFEDKGWVQSYHTFSFESYYDMEYLNYRNLRVLNEEYIQGGKGLGEQFHKDLILCTYVLSGVLEYKDHYGQVHTIRADELFVLNSGTGTNYSMYNLSHHEPVHFYQFWFNPEQNALPSSVEKKIIQSAAKWGQWCLMLSHNGRSGSLRVHQDIDLYSTYLEANESISFDAFPERYYWLQVIYGKFIVQKDILSAGDGLMINEEMDIKISCLEEGEILLFDQP